MTGQIQSINVIKRQARAAADSGKPITECPYMQGSPYAKRWIAEYLMRECELEQERERVEAEKKQAEVV